MPHPQRSNSWLLLSKEDKSLSFGMDWAEAVYRFDIRGDAFLALKDGDVSILAFVFKLEFLDNMLISYSKLLIFLVFIERMVVFDVWRSNIFILLVSRPLSSGTRKQIIYL